MDRSRAAQVADLLRNLMAFCLVATLVMCGARFPVPHGVGEGGGHWIHAVEQLLTRAAWEGRAWHAERHRVERSVHDIVVLLEFAWKAARRAEFLHASDHRARAVGLLERAVGKGYFRATDLAPVYELIERHLPTQGGPASVERPDVGGAFLLQAGDVSP